MPGVKNPMCNAFPRIGNPRFPNMLSLCNIRLHATRYNECSRISIHIVRIIPTKIYLASCDYWRYGAGGRQENINAICILNLNVINDKVTDTVVWKLELNIVNILLPYYTQVFLLLWWWFYLIAFLSFLRVLYRAVQCRRVQYRFYRLSHNIQFVSHVSPLSSTKLTFSRSAWLRFKLLDLRLHRYFKRSSKIDLIRNYILACKLGDW